MYTIIRYQVGVVVEAVVLAEGGNRMRVAVAGFPDTLELERSGPQWFTAARQPVEFDFLMSRTDQGESVSTLSPSLAARAAGDSANK